MHQPAGRFGAAALALASCAAPAQASIVFDSTGAGGGFNPSVWMTIADDGAPGPPRGLLLSFTVSRPVRITGASLPLALESAGTPAQVVVSLHEGPAFDIPPTDIESAPALVVASDVPATFDVAFSGATVMVPGIAYGVSVVMTGPTPVRWMGEAGGAVIMTLTPSGGFAPIDTGSVPSVSVRGLPVAGACPGDANGDGLVDTSDLSFVIFRLGGAGAPGAVVGDANGDGVVSTDDIAFVVFRLGPCAGG